MLDAKTDQKTVGRQSGLVALIPPTGYRKFRLVDSCDRPIYYGLQLVALLISLGCIWSVLTSLALIGSWLFLPTLGLMTWFILVSILTNQSPLRYPLPRIILWGIIPMLIFFVIILYQQATQQSGILNLWDTLIVSTILATLGSFPLIQGIWQRQQLSTSPEQGHSRTRFHCAICCQPLKRLPESDLMPLLTKIEQATHKLNSVVYDGWWCPHCHPQYSRDTIHLRGYMLQRPRHVKKCPHCQDYTVQHTARKTHKRYIEREFCHSCDYRDHWLQRIAGNERRTRHQTGNSTSQTSINYLGGYRGVSGGGGSSGGGNGGSFGGGSSGGGGGGSSF
ncbi:hypothetical protein K4A83_16155 [Spirulina subsalsa FACHB-351]|uniref:TPM domain-containing protein n=1 Tax=Spirulina subsalsa FACHB-351 TaxID=234711 RepID=A0ABT3L8F2_9CYAN|nr:hypothetical protein [Spirulina subsalsa]MCW6037792.1 hypothetical protein [Spirulina subsalsa FACHB-351]